MQLLLWYVVAKAQCTPSSDTMKISHTTQLVPLYDVPKIECTWSSETVKVRQTQGFNDPALMLLLCSFYLGMLMLR